MRFNVPRPRRTDDRGTSLPELLVVMLILSIITVATATLTIGFQRTNAQNITRQDQIDAARTAVERVTKTVRTAVKPSQLNTSCAGACAVDAFMMAEGYSVKFYGNLDNTKNSVGPSRVSYTVATTGPDAGVLIEKVQRPSSFDATAGYQYCDAEAQGASAICKSQLTTQRLAVGVQTSGPNPLFRYFGPDGLQMTPAAGSDLSSGQLSEVMSIEIDANIQTPKATRVDATEYFQRVLLPNSQAVIQAGQDATP